MRRLVLPVVLAGVLAACVPPAGGGDLPGLDRERLVDATALDGPDCAVVEPGDTEDRDHLDPADAPPAAQLYDEPLPAGGPHYGSWLEPLDTLPETALDVRAVLHNLEHGAVVVWVDPEFVDAEQRAELQLWRQQLGAAGFDDQRTGAAVFVTPVPAGVSVGAGVAYRAWGVAIDCAGWDVAQADAFVATHYGSRGDAPEGGLGPYPEDNGVLRDPAGDATTA